MDLRRSTGRRSTRRHCIRCCGGTAINGIFPGSWRAISSASATPGFADAALPVYGTILAVYGVREWRIWRASGHLNVARNLLLTGTALSWWTGIIVLDSDLAFLYATNVLAHGIPYMALIWLYGRNQARRDGQRPVMGCIPAWVPVFVGVRAAVRRAADPVRLYRGRLVGWPGLDRAPNVVPPVRQLAGDRRWRHSGLAGAAARVAANHALPAGRVHLAAASTRNRLEADDVFRAQSGWFTRPRAPSARGAFRARRRPGKRAWSATARERGTSRLSPVAAAMTLFIIGRKGWPRRRTADAIADSALGSLNMARTREGTMLPMPQLCRRRPRPTRGRYPLRCPPAPWHPGRPREMPGTARIRRCCPSCRSQTRRTAARRLASVSGRTATPETWEM